MVELLIAFTLAFHSFLSIEVNEYGQEQVYAWGNTTVDKFGNTAADRERLAKQ